MNAIQHSALKVVRPTAVHHQVLAALLVVTAINYVQRNWGPAETAIRADLGLEKWQTGDALAAFFLSYAFCQVPSGLLAQYCGARLALTLFTVGWSLTVALTTLASSYTELYLYRLLLGALQAGIFPCATLILSSWYPSSQRGLASALLNSFMLIGGAVGSALTGFLLTSLGWRPVFLLYALPGLLWAVWFGIWFRNRPQDHPGVNAAELAILAEGRGTDPAPEAGTDLPDPAPVVADPSKDDSLQVTTDPLPERSSLPPEEAPKVSLSWWAYVLPMMSLALVCVQQAFRAGANRLYDNWLPTYFQEARGGSPAMSGVLTGLPLVAGVVGGVVGGMISDAVLRRTGSRSAGRKGVSIVSLLLGTVFFLLAYPISNVWLATVIFSMGAFVTMFAAPCSYALTMDMGGKYVAVIFGVMNMVGNFGASAFIALVPRLITWGGWNLALAVFVGLHVAAAICWLFVNPDGVIGEPRKT